MNGEQTVRTGAFSKILATIVVSVVGLTAPFQVNAQSPDMQAIELKKQAMSAYGDLNLDTAIQLLDQAAAMGAQLSANTVAQIYVSYGLVYVGGHGDNARGQEYFTIARCLDGSTGIDPLYSTPEVDLIFKMAQSRATPQTCPALLANVSYLGGGALQPVQPIQPVQPMQPVVQPGMLPPCGIHNAPIQQRKSMELPLAIQMDPNRVSALGRVVIKYAYDGSTTYFEMEMNKASNGWVTGMLSCDEGQISAFDPSTIAYFIEGYDLTGGLVCGHGSSVQPFNVTMNPNAAVVSSMPGMNPPQTCEECPPWDQDCHADKGEAIPCFADDECLEGQWCSDTGYCEGDAVGGEGDTGWDDPASSGSGPQKFYVNITAGTGLGIVSSGGMTHNRAWLGEDSSVPGGARFFAFDEGAFSGATWGGIPLRLNVGFVLNPKFSLELGGRFDLHSLFAKQKDLLNCDNENDLYYDEPTGYTCYQPQSTEHSSIWAGSDNTNAIYVFAEEKSLASKAWLVNIRGRYKFIDKGRLKGSFFAGVGYGHLFYAPKKADLDLDGTNDPYVITPGMINIELGPGMAIYLNRYFGFIFDLPIDMMLGEDGSFGLNVELAVGISFGG